ncbi:MAG: aspartate kinase [Peptococcaceae bacterium]|jgi:aspartate kinase|nr:aspartate kinase [Peptococcaceae bacterium]
MLVVQKYGGSSVADADRIRRVAGRVADVRKAGHDVVVVVSAMGDTTDELISLMNEVTDCPREREMDMLLSTGEQVSIALLAMAVFELGLPVISLTGPQVGILTDDTHTKARIIDIQPNRLRSELAAGKVIVVAGFQGVNAANDITTLGRGGSDTSAVALAAALSADLCEIYTDVDGVYTADPRLVPDAKKLPYILYDEMLELAHLGAVVLHPRAVECAKLYGIPVHVRSSFNLNLGTIVREAGETERPNVVTGVAHDLNVARIAIFDVYDRPGVAHHIFEELAGAGVNVDMIVQSAMRDGINDIAFTVSKTEVKKAVAVIDRIKEDVGSGGFAADDDVAKVSVVGAGMISHPGVAAHVFGALADTGINIEMISTSEIGISCLVKASEALRAVRALHDRFRPPAGGE